MSGVRRKRLLFRCWHRGTPRDLILGPFVQNLSREVRRGPGTRQPNVWRQQAAR